MKPNFINIKFSIILFSITFFLFWYNRNERMKLPTCLSTMYIYLGTFQITPSKLKSSTYSDCMLPLVQDYNAPLLLWCLCGCLSPYNIRESLSLSYLRALSTLTHFLTSSQPSFLELGTNCMYRDGLNMIYLFQEEPKRDYQELQRSR